MKQFLSPTLDDLRTECVLMQAWKKTAGYLRQHSWYADTFEIDYQSLRIPDFIREIQERLQSPEAWTPSPLEFVPAPKGQSWKLRENEWKPRENIRTKIRPLAHVSLQDQVVATALLMCLADRVEGILGDPLLSIEKPANRRNVLAYGHRLFCDSSDGLRHRWGSSKLYRLFYRDYQTFLRRPEVVSNHLKVAAAVMDREVAIVQSDLSKFYDRVRPSLLHDKVHRLLGGSEENDFSVLFQSLFDWRWKDRERAQAYGKLHEIEDFDQVALPQGLVAGGFFANVAMRDFDAALRGGLGQPIDAEGRFVLEDVCYYVDDLRLVLMVEKGADEVAIEHAVQNWLQGLLDLHTPGLLVEASKTKATVEGRQKRFLVPQSKTATRIQHDISGVFDMLHGTELIGAIEGFFHTQKRYSSTSEQGATGRSGLLVGISDMRDETAARFAAGRFRRTFRSLRPLLTDESVNDPENSDEENDGSTGSPSRLVLSREQLDERGQLFSAMLIDEWVANPGNVRLLRIALDLYPDAEFLDRVLGLLRPGWDLGGARGENREVRQYCLAELFRAGATETGMVSDDDCLPSDIDIDSYHQRLTEEATAVLISAFSTNTAPKRFPWFLLQQAFLYLAIRNQVPDVILASTTRSRGLFRHLRFARFLSGAGRLPLAERSVFLVLALSSFGLDEAIDGVVSGQVSPKFLLSVGEVSPITAAKVWQRLKENRTEGQSQVARSLGLEMSIAPKGKASVLADLVTRKDNPFWEEENLLRLASELLARPESDWPEVLTPWQIVCEVRKLAGVKGVAVKKETVKITGALPRSAHLFVPPSWCESTEDKRRFQLGAILRYSLRGSVDLFSSSFAKPRAGLRPRYRAPISHWERQRYSTFQGRTAFGPPWIPISSWTEDFLFDLLRWPGSGLSSPLVDLSEWAQRLENRLGVLKKARGNATRLAFLEQSAPWPDKPPTSDWKRPLRVGIVQAIIPDMGDYGEHSNDPQLIGDPSFRIRHRQHLAAILEAVVQLLQVRETHRTQNRHDGRILDLLVFPELSIHPLDIQPLILPFIRTHKCMVLFGQVYHPLDPDSDSPLINSCLWAIPEWRVSSGFQVRFVEQGKEHLTQDELGLNPSPVPFRPAQWLVNYQWSSNRQFRPLTMSASVCYDATDLSLASDLKSRSDLYLICALNQDVGTFDRMSEGLHYHMYQGVIVVNNGQFGGSSFYMPFGQSFQRQVLHLHGQPQATIAFAEILPEKLVDRPSEAHDEPPEGEWKTPPANWP
ncbi:MAG: RNA-directed DNA polymerase [Verrucomicrobiae bacterium]|nr:RNA-directed DNA polymerase [Verrucomicrobiae bacterium]